MNSWSPRTPPAAGANRRQCLSARHARHNKSRLQRYRCIRLTLCPAVQVSGSVKFKMCVSESGAVSQNLTYFYLRQGLTPQLLPNPVSQRFRAALIPTLETISHGMSDSAAVCSHSVGCEYPWEFLCCITVHPQ